MARLHPLKPQSPYNGSNVPTKNTLPILLMTLATCAPPRDPELWTPTTDPLELARRYTVFTDTFDAHTIETRYADAVAKIDSDDPKTQLEGARTLSATGDIEALIRIAPLLGSDDASVRIWTGSYLSDAIERIALLRRDDRLHDAVILLPPDKAQPDLRPFAWIVFEMLRQPDDGSTHAYAARMIRYLQLHEFVPLLEPFLESRHPAVRRSTETALTYLELQRAFNAHPERDHPNVQNALNALAYVQSKHEAEAAAWSRAVTTASPDPPK